jgi:hypothetical protein
MNYGAAIEEIKKGNKVWRPSIVKGYFVKLRGDKIILKGKDGSSTPFRPSDADQLAIDWELVTDTKLTRVLVTKTITFSAVCPDLECATVNAINKADLNKTGTVIITCSKCGDSFEVYNESGNVVDGLPV